MASGATMNPPRFPSIESQNAPISPHASSSSSPETRRNRTGPSDSAAGAATGSCIAASGATSCSDVYPFVSMSRGPPAANSSHPNGARQRTEGYFVCADRPPSDLGPPPRAKREPCNDLVVFGLAGLKEAGGCVQALRDGVVRVVGERRLAGPGHVPEPVDQRRERGSTVALALLAPVDDEPADPVAAVGGIARPHDESHG